MTTARKALLIGLVFSILGGIAPLIPPNEFMPADIRIGHGFEVGVSNLIYGVILGYLWGVSRTNEGQKSTIIYHLSGIIYRLRVAMEVFRAKHGANRKGI
jgi:hypothetical protein